jgi:hypothetical protein
MNVTTNKSESNPKRDIRQLEVAIDHARAAALAAPDAGDSDPSFVEVRYPTYQFRETLRALRPDAAEYCGCLVILESGEVSTAAGSRAACKVLRHYYPEEDFIVSVKTGPTVIDSVAS